MFFAEIFAERHAGDLLDHQAQHVEAEAVVPHRARLVQQRHAAQAVEKFPPVIAAPATPLPSGYSLCTGVVPRPP